MEDPQNPSDYIAPPPRPGTLPPTGKVVREVFAGIERLGLVWGMPILCLMAAKWEVPSRELAGMAFLSSVSTILGAHFALRRGEHQEK